MGSPPFTKGKKEIIQYKILLLGLSVFFDPFNIHQGLKVVFSYDYYHGYFLTSDTTMWYLVVFHSTKRN
jgi:hypothetical protein